MFSPLGRVGLNGPGGIFSFSFLADVVMTEKILNELSLKKNLTLLDSINPEVFLGIFVSIFNFFEFKFKLFESSRYVPVQTGTGAHRYHRYSRYTGRFAPVRRTMVGAKWNPFHPQGHHGLLQLRKLYHRARQTLRLQSCSNGHGRSSNQVSGTAIRVP
jgi:hypothetical protein